MGRRRPRAIPQDRGLWTLQNGNVMSAKVWRMSQTRGRGAWGDQTSDVAGDLRLSHIHQKTSGGHFWDNWGREPMSCIQTINVTVWMQHFQGEGALPSRMLLFLGDYFCLWRGPLKAADIASSSKYL